MIWSVRASLKEKMRLVLQEVEILVEWQTANLVLHGKLIVHLTNNLGPPCDFTEISNAIAFAEFAWDYVSVPDKAELKLHNMFDSMWNL
jgi:hypothetical protein